MLKHNRSYATQPLDHEIDLGQKAMSLNLEISAPEFCKKYGRNDTLRDEMQHKTIHKIILKQSHKLPERILLDHIHLKCHDCFLLQS